MCSSPLKKKHLASAQAPLSRASVTGDRNRGFKRLCKRHTWISSEMQAGSLGSGHLRGGSERSPGSFPSPQDSVKGVLPSSPHTLLSAIWENNPQIPNVNFSLLNSAPTEYRHVTPLIPSALSRTRQDLLPGANTRWATVHFSRSTPITHFLEKQGQSTPLMLHFILQHSVPNPH